MSKIVYGGLKDMYEMLGLVLIYIYIYIKSKRLQKINEIKTDNGSLIK
jgi:hypothetical protein